MCHDRDLPNNAGNLRDDTLKSQVLCMPKTGGSKQLKVIGNTVFRQNAIYAESWLIYQVWEFLDLMNQPWLCTTVFHGPNEGLVSRVSSAPVGFLMSKYSCQNIFCTVWLIKLDLDSNWGGTAGARPVEKRDPRQLKKGPQSYQVSSRAFKLTH